MQDPNSTRYICGPKVEKLFRSQGVDKDDYRNHSKNLRRFCKLVRENIYPNLRFKLHHNTRYCTEDHLDVLTHVALTHDFTQNGSRTFGFYRKDETPSSKTILYHIAKFEVEELLEVFKRTFDQIFDMAKAYGIFDEKVDLAIDYTDQMYYGDRTSLPMVTGTKPNRGTCYAFKFATINIVSEGKRFTLMALPKHFLATDEKIVRELITYAKSRVKVGVVYLDRGFYTVGVIRLLEELGVKYVIPAIHSQRVVRILQEVEPPCVMDYQIGIIRRFKGKARFKNPVSTKLAIIEDEKGKRAFATNLEIQGKEATAIADMYGKRWGIETSYRVKNEFRPRTTSKNYVVRLFYFLFSACLYNLWILANVFIGTIIKWTILKPLITAKVFGTLLYTSFYIDDGG